ncbi:hypothetical protein FACS189491_10480 [Spirochaetia bacterium]|nr:hypothetical protein FACS189491_10480 [Spirochaetia bacterium]
MTISELVRIRMPTEAGKVIADALQARRDIYDGKVRPDPHFVRLADPIFGALVYNMADWILDTDALGRDDKLKIGFKNLTASADDVEAHAVKIERARLFENKRYPYQQEADAWRTTAHAMYETIGLLHELERNAATPQAKPDTLEKNKAYMVHIHDVNNGQFNFATDNAVIHAAQNNGLNNQKLGTILTNLLQKIPASITEQEKEQITESVDFIRTEAQKKQPKKNMIKTALSWLQAIKGSAEFAAAVTTLYVFFHSIGWI